MNKPPNFSSLPWWTWVLVALAVLGLITLGVQAVLD